VAAIQSGRVRIGVTAPRHVRVDRHEVSSRRAQFGSVSRRSPASILLA
jgi:sRNA-binding carbon storage regulator CsrA